jgi:hypothetical protein
MQVSSLQQSRASAAVRWLVLLCLALVTITATAQAVHFHPDQAVGAANHCSICVVMHSAAVAAHQVQLDSSFQTSGYLHVSVESGHISSLASFALFSRPPPLV